MTETLLTPQNNNFVGFSAYLSSNTAFANDAIIVCDTEKFDIGGNYVAASGWFTTPTTGYYYFGGKMHVGTTVAGDRYGLRLNCGGTLYDYHIQAAHGTDGITCRLENVVYLASGVNVRITCYESTAGSPTLTGGNDDTQFWGYLIASLGNP